MNRIDKKFDKLGFEKDVENKWGACYIKDLGKYRHVLAITHKTYDGGKTGYLIRSYQQELNSDSLNNSVALTPKEAKLALKTVRYLKRKYRKDWR